MTLCLRTCCNRPFLAIITAKFKVAKIGKISRKNISEYRRKNWKIIIQTGKILDEQNLKLDKNFEKNIEILVL